ncbi:MAG: DUF5793 family protein [Haloarculaceae archaeon]
MRRDYVTLTVRLPDRDETDIPAVELAFDGPLDQLEGRLQDADGTPRQGDDVDVAYRLQTPMEAENPAGVFSITDRLTGEYLLEANAEAEQVLDLVAAARATDERGDGPDGCYRVELHDDGDRTWTFEKETLLVYDHEGSLLRKESLIPSGIEL